MLYDVFLWYNNPWVWWHDFGLSYTKQLNSHLHKALCKENNVRYLYHDAEICVETNPAPFPVSFFLFMTTERFDEQWHPSAADISPADVWMRRIFDIFVPRDIFSINVKQCEFEVKWRCVCMCVYIYIYIYLMSVSDAYLEVGLLILHVYCVLVAWLLNRRSAVSVCSHD